MLRPSSLLRALAAVAAGVLACLGPGLVGTVSSQAHADIARPPDPSQPLVLRMRSITPDYLPEHGPIVIRGRVTNSSDEEWTAINVEGFVGSAPLTTTAQLAAAAQTSVTADVGHRITTAGTFDTIASLQPGESTSFKVTLPRSQILVTAPGVYWFGVHALGATAEGRSASAAGRDRAFLPLVPASATTGGRRESAALVLPVRAGVTRGPDGTIQDTAAWVSSLRSGPLHDLLNVGRAAHGRPLSWLVDPAVLDVVRRLAAGNLPRTLESEGSKTASDGPTASASADASASGTAASTAPSRTARVATHWLHRLHRLLATTPGELFGLPYGDVAVDTAVSYDPALLDAAFRHTGRFLAPWGLSLSRVVAPPDGRATAETVAGLPRDTTVLLDDRGITGSAPTVNDVGGRRVVLSSAGAAEGGPGPVNPVSPLALRQRILAEAALRLLDHQQPLVVQLPAAVHHRIGPSFFKGFDVPWLDLTTLDDAAGAQSSPLDAGRLRAPTPDTLALGPRLYARADRVLDEAGTLQSVLAGNTVLRRRVFEETTGNASYAAADDRYGALARVRSTGDWVTANLEGIDLTAPEKVTLASVSGRFSAVVSNELDVPVTVKVRAIADPMLHISGGDPIRLPPHGRTTVLLNASTHVLGVHTVRLELTNLAGRPLGSADEFPMRAEQVSRLIWVIIGAGVGLLFAAIVVRLVRRILRSRTA